MVGADADSRNYTNVYAKPARKKQFPPKRILLWQNQIDLTKAEFNKRISNTGWHFETTSATSLASSTFCHLRIRSNITLIWKILPRSTKTSFTSVKVTDQEKELAQMFGAYSIPLRFLCRCAWFTT